MTRPPIELTENTEHTPVVFRGSNGLWLMLAVLGTVGLLVTLALGVPPLFSDEATLSLKPLLLGAAFTALCILGAVFAWGQRRDLIIDEAGVTIRSSTGTLREQIPWGELDAVEERRMPSQPMQVSLLLHRNNGTALLIDPQQVSNTGTIARMIRGHASYRGAREESKRRERDRDRGR